MIAGSSVASSVAAAETAPAGGAALGEMVIVGGATSAVSALIVVLGLRLRAGGLVPVRRLAERLGEASGLAPWAALPLIVMLLGLLSCFYGMTADIGWHMNEGRDEGALGNATHYPILLGLFVWLAGAFLAVILPRQGERPGRGAVRLTREWQLPVGGLVALIGVSAALISFPLDDAWHRLFGQDVTFWGPTHLVLVGGGTVAVLGMVLLFVAGTVVPAGERSPLAFRVGRGVVAAALTAAPSVYLLEWHFGLPQAAMLHDPILLSLSAGGLIVGRLWLGRGGALTAAAGAFAITLALSLLAGPAIGQAAPRFGLLIPAGVLVELAALALATRRPWRLAVASGVLVGTLGLLAERVWTDLYRPLEWSGAIVPEMLVLGTITATSAALLGVVVTGALTARAELITGPAGRTAVGAAVAIIAVLVFISLPQPPTGVRAEITLTETKDAPEREAWVGVRFDPPSAAQGTDWLRVVAWQGGGIVNEPLVPTGDGAWRSAAPVPLHGSWKTSIRVSKDGGRGGIGLYAPADAAIPAAAVTTPALATRPLVDEQLFLQRERRDDTPQWLWNAAMAVVWSLWAALLALTAWAFRRLGTDGARAAFPRRVAARLPFGRTAAVER